MNGYEISVTMYKHQHDRWNQWALFFFGSIVSVFVLEEKVEIITSWISLLLASFLSIIWVAVAISIRRTTTAWRDTIFQLEKDNIIKDNEVNVFHIQEEIWKKTDPWTDLKVTVCLWNMETFKSVTRMLTLIGLLSSVFFFLLFLKSIFCLN
jgi:L-lactate permease